MALGYTLHSVLRGKEELPIGTVVEFSDKDYGDLLRLGAIREPSEAELQLHGLGKGAAEQAETKAPKKSGRKSAKDNAEPKSEGAGEADKDPEVDPGELDI